MLSEVFFQFKEVCRKQTKGREIGYFAKYQMTSLLNKLVI